MPIVGIVKWFDFNKGYGFLQRDDGEGDVFVHARAVQDSGLGSELIEGERLSFAIGERHSRKMAVDLKRVR